MMIGYKAYFFIKNFLLGKEILCGGGPRGIAFFGQRFLKCEKETQTFASSRVLGQLWWAETKIFPNNQLITAHMHQAWEMSCFLVSIWVKSMEMSRGKFLCFAKAKNEKVGKRIFNFRRESLMQIFPQSGNHNHATHCWSWHAFSIS